MANSYYLYQLYEKRGSQPFHPAYPVEYSVDGNGTMTKVMKMANDPNCDGVDPVRYQWVIVSGDYMCSGTTKCQKEKEQRSDDFGVTWTDTGRYRAGSPIEYNSVDCGWVPPQYRTVSGSPYCNGYTKMVDTYNQVSNDGGQTWQNTGVSGSVVVQYDSPDCGYPIYRWVDTDSYVCEDETPIEYGYVDLGLPSGTLWADRNVGARNVGDEGLYFRWGATRGFTSAQAEDSTFVENAPQEYNAKYEPYWGNSGILTLRPEDDAATQNMGSQWRMPTARDWDELTQNTDLVRESSYPYPCYLRSKINGNRLSFPLAGRYFEPNLGSPNPDRGKVAFIWSSSRSSQGSSNSFVYDNYPAGFEHISNPTWSSPSRQFLFYDRRSYALSVRGIKNTPQYRTVSGTPYCDGYDLVVDTQEQVSYDNGVTWNDTTSGTSVVMHNSPACGYVPHSYSDEYMTFDILSSGTITWKNTTSNSSNAKIIYYTTDSGLTWTPLKSTTAGTSFNVSAGDKVMFKGSYKKYQYATFGGTAKFNVEGNTMSMLYADDFSGKTILESGATFISLFRDNGNVLSAENLILPATVMTNDCYTSMFEGCTSLTTPPALPATTLAYGCYHSMFKGCTSLTTTPSLPAMTLADYCYAWMFNGCTSLTATPTLPATTLADRCYFGMFGDCTSLTTTTQLPATTMATYCYNNMFSGCTSLTTAPALPATTLAEACYMYMFAFCSNLSHVECLATDISAQLCTNRWLWYVSASGTFTKATSMTDWTRDEHGIPSGWTVQDAS